MNAAWAARGEILIGEDARRSTIHQILHEPILEQNNAI